MASQELLDLIAQITDEEAKKNFIAVCDKNEALDRALREGTLRQSDYSRKQNELQKEFTKKQEALDKQTREYSDLYQQNVKWKQEHETKFTSLATERDQLAKDKAALEQQIKTAVSNNPAVREGDVTPEQLDAEVRKVLASTGVLSKTDIDTVVTQQAQKMVADSAAAMKKEFYEKDLPVATQFQMDMVDLAFKNQREFNEPLDRDSFAKYMQEAQLSDPKKAYDQFVSDRRNKATLEAETKKAVEEAEKKIRDEYSKNNIPGATGSTPGSGNELGAIQMRQMREKAEANGGPVGGGAAAAAQELRQAGKI